MKKRLFVSLLAGLAVAFLTPAMARAQSAFDGTWKVDVSKAQLPRKPDVFLLKDGMYECNSCVPPVKVKADGQDHAVSGHPYYDSVKIEVVDDHTIKETDKKDGKTVTTSTTNISSDGKTLSFDFSDSSATNADPVTGKGEEARLMKGPAGSHAVSGSWRITKFDTLSDNAVTVTYKTDGDSLTMTNPTGQSYTAKMDGTDAPYKGDPGTSSVSVKRLGRHSFEETDKRDGKIISVTRVVVSPEGKTMTFDVSDRLHGTTSKFVAEKQ